MKRSIKKYHQSSTTHQDRIIEKCFQRFYQNFDTKFIEELLNAMKNKEFLEKKTMNNVNLKETQIITSLHEKNYNEYSQMEPISHFSETIFHIPSKSFPERSYSKLISGSNNTKPL